MKNINTREIITKQSEIQEKQLKFINELTTKTDMELIILLQQNKDKIDKKFFEILDIEIVNAFEKGKQERLDSLLYLSQIIDNLKIFQPLREEAKITPENLEKINKEEIFEDEAFEFPGYNQENSEDEVTGEEHFDFEEKIIDLETFQEESTEGQSFEEDFDEISFQEESTEGQSFEEDFDEISFQEEAIKTSHVRLYDEYEEYLNEDENEYLELDIIYCSKCGTENKIKSNFCSNCGNKLKIPEGHKKIEKIGKILCDRYEIIESIKEGGMGAVYKGMDLIRGELCAIKELLHKTITLKDKEKSIQRFKSEAKILYNMRHPNLPIVVDYFALNNKYYMVMEFIEGKDMNTILKEKGEKGLPENEVIDIGIQICNILNYLHSHNPPIIYRDIKPSNIMIRNSDNTIMLIDFGIALIKEETEQSSTITAIGTTGYMPPEQYRGKPELRSDLYSLGATMHHLLTGKNPIPFVFNSIKKIRPDISNELDFIITTAVKLKPKERYDSAAEMQKALMACKNSIKEKSQKAEPVAKSIKPEQKNKNLEKINNTISKFDDSGLSFLALLFNKNIIDIENFNLKKVCSILKYDPPLAMKVINTARAINKEPEKISSTVIAINLLGTEKSSEIIERAFYSNIMTSIKRTEAFKQICYHSLGVAIFAKLTASQFTLDEDEMYMLGLMHDIGKIILYVSLPDEYEETLRKTKEKFITIGDAEKEYLGIDHCEMGKITLKKWNYPDKFIKIAGHHHNIENIKNPDLYNQLLCVQVSNILCNLARIGNVDSVRTMKFELFDKKMKEFIEGVNIPQLMVKARIEISMLEQMFIT